MTRPAPVIVIRADASTVIGTGHVTRTLALASMLRERGATVRFVQRRFPGDRVSLVRERGFEVTELGAGRAERENGWLGVSLSEETERFLSALESRKPLPQWVVVDHYELDEQWEAAVRSIGIGVFAIDDLADRSHCADVILDTTPAGPERYVNRVAPWTRLLLGPRFALLDEAFVRRGAPPVRNGAVGRVVVFYGGIDSAGETLKAARALHLSSGSFQVDVVPGSDEGHRAALDELARSDGRFAVHHHWVDMAELLASCDLALGAGGTATWERLFMGVPSIVSAVAENQVHVVDLLGRAGALYPLGRSQHVSAADIVNALRELQADPQRCVRMGSIARAQLDGWADARDEVARILLR